MQPEFTYTIHSLGVKVAALITADMISRRLTDTFNADRIIIPGRCRGDLDKLSEQFNTPFERGPEELKDLPLYFGKSSFKHDLNHYTLQIFAEIVDAPNNSVKSTLSRAAYYREQGANVIDIGCLPDTPFPHLEAVIKALKDEDYLEDNFAVLDELIDLGLVLLVRVVLHPEKQRVDHNKGSNEVLEPFCLDKPD